MENFVFCFARTLVTLAALLLCFFPLVKCDPIRETVQIWATGHILETISLNSEEHSNPLLTTVTRPILKLPSHGDQNGTLFDDVNNITMPVTVVKVTSIAIGSLYQVDYIQVKYLLSNGSLYTAPEHGDGIFTPDTITLGSDEYLERIDGKTNGQYVNQLTITTYRPSVQQRAVYGPYGTTKLNATQDYVFQGNILGFYGSYGKYVLSSLGAYTFAPVKKSTFFGYFNSKVGTNFTDNPDAMFPPVVKINKLYIRHGNQINSLQAEYQLYGGEKAKGPWHGGKGQSGNVTVIKFTPDEHLVGVKGMLASGPFNVLQQLSFVTVNRKSSVKVYGPFGSQGNTTFSLNANIVGLGGFVFKNVVAGFQVYCF